MKQHQLLNADLPLTFGLALGARLDALTMEHGVERLLARGANHILLRVMDNQAILDRLPACVWKLCLEFVTREKSTAVFNWSLALMLTKLLPPDELSLMCARVYEDARAALADPEEAPDVIALRAHGAKAGTFAYYLLVGNPFDDKFIQLLNFIVTDQLDGADYCNNIALKLAELRRSQQSGSGSTTSGDKPESA